MAEWPDNENFLSPLGDLIVAMESVAPALEEVLRQCLEDGLYGLDDASACWVRGVRKAWLKYLIFVFSWKIARGG
jgi:hypothetical protein